MQVTKYAFPWEIALHILAHVRIYPTLIVQPPTHASSLCARASYIAAARARAHATKQLSPRRPRLSNFILVPPGETAAVNGASSAPHFRGITKWARWYLSVPGHLRRQLLGTHVPPIPLSAGAPLGTSKWEKFHPLEPKVCPKVSSAFPRVRTAEQRRSEPRRNCCRQKRCALAPTPPSASASLSLPR